MGFWQALSALAPVPSALADAHALRLAQQQEQQQFAQESALRDAQVTAQKLAAQAEEQRIKQGAQPIIIGEPKWDPTKHAMVATSFDPNTGSLKLQVVPGGVDPLAEQDAVYKAQVDDWTKVHGAKPTPEQDAAFWYAAHGIKPPAAKFTPLPGAAGQPQLGPDGKTYGVYGRNAEGEIVWNPVGQDYKQPVHNTPLNTQYVQVMGKDPSTWTAEDQKFIKGYGAYLKAQEALAGARGAAYNASRPVQVQDPNNPGNVIVMPAGQAEALGVPTTQSIPFRVKYATESALSRLFTSGTAATNIRTLNTAVAHLDLLRHLSEALDNGDVRLWNSARQAYNKATGNPAPVNFDMLRDSLAGEMARVFTGVGATQNEIAEITGPISAANSPAQLIGAIDTAKAAMDSRLQALKEQYAAGKVGAPAFRGAVPAVTPPAPSGASPAADPVTQFLLTVPGGNSGPR